MRSIPIRLQHCRPFAPYDVPNPRTWSPDKSRPIHLEATSTNDIASDPGHLAPPMEQKVDNAVVKIEREDAYGSGFLATGRHGEPVVVTAAHVAIPEKIHAVTITDTDGNTSEVAGGCYAYAHTDAAFRPDGVSGAQIDIAILRLKHKIGGATLSFANAPPNRGDWVHFYNFQQDRDITNPARYNGIALDQQSTWMDNMVLTGLKNETDSALVENVISPGASGGAVVNRNAEVTSMIVSGMSVAEEEHLSTYFGVGPPMVYTHQTSSLPYTIAGTVDATNIVDALSRGDY